MPTQVVRTDGGAHKHLRRGSVMGIGVAALLLVGASAAHAEERALLKQVKASQTRAHDIVDLRFDRAPSLFSMAQVKNPKYVEQVQMGESDDKLKLPGKAVLSVYLDYASTYNFNGPQIPSARQQLTRRNGNILRAQSNNEHAGRLDFAVAVATPRKATVLVQRRAKRVRIMIARRGPVMPVVCQESDTPLVPVGRWNMAMRITSATRMRCAQVARVIANANTVNTPIITAGLPFTIGAFTCRAGAADPQTGVATGRCRLGKRTFTVQSAEAYS